MAEEKQEIKETVTPAEEEEEIEIKPPFEEKEEESQEEEEDSYEQRYKDLQSHSDKREARYKKLLDPFSKNIIEDENGDLSFKFDDTPQKAEDIPEAATQDDWDTDPKAAEEKQYKYRHYHEKIERDNTAKIAKETKDAEDASKEYDDKRINVYWKKAQELYPDVKDKDSALFKKAQKILDADPNMTASPRCDLIAVKEAAAELGITPQGAKPKKKSSYIIGGSSGSGGKGEDKKLSDDEFSKLSPDEQNAYMKKSVFNE